MTINRQAYLNLKKGLAHGLISGCETGVRIIKPDIPIDTQRLYETARVDTSELNLNHSTLKVKIVVGGMALRGIRREQDKIRDVDYAIQMERRDGYLQGNIPLVTNAIVDEFEM